MSVEPKRRALITGAMRKIGTATALAFAKAGIDLALVNNFLEKLAVVAGLAKHQGVASQSYAVDLAIVWQVKDQIQAIAFSQTLAPKQCDRGIRLTAICPGAMNTQLWNQALLLPQAVINELMLST